MKLTKAAKLAALTLYIPMPIKWKFQSSVWVYKLLAALERKP